MQKITRRTLSSFFLAGVLILLAVLSTSFVFDPVYAQTGGQVEELTGYTEPGAGKFYNIPNLKQGDTLYVYVTGTSGNLDPFVALADATLNINTLADDFDRETNQAIAAGGDPLAVIPQFADQYFLTWDDDGGPGYAAAFELPIPADGDYQLLVLSTPAKGTFGNYRLLLGVNAPEVLTGTAEPTGDHLAFQGERLADVNLAVQEITGTLTTEKTTTFLNLTDFEPEDTLYVFVEATSGDLKPIVELKDFGLKPLATGNFSGQQTTTAFQYTFDDGGSNYRLEITACCEDGPVTTGDYRILVGINTPEVLSGNAATSGGTILLQPTEVMIGVKMQQITSVDQKAENFGVVASMQMEWLDPTLAFSPDTCDCNFKTLTRADLIDYVAERDTRWPEFTLYNQQGNRWSQNQVAVVFSDGRALYLERFSATLQAPDFDFRRFPFDTQQFYIRIDMLYPEEFYVLTNLPGYSEVGGQLGEEEWVVTDHDTAISSETASTQSQTSRFSFGFIARRHLNFYIFRIFVPLAIIIIMSWIVFFLKDYGKRVEATSANLLIFIAFNFTISNDLPRLGYLTLLDSMLVSTFIVTGLVLIFNVYLRRLEVDGKRNIAHRIDQYTLWIYPVAYIIAFAVVTYFFA